MMFGGRHNRQCETAKLHVCRCTACGGALHGWVGSIAMARPELAEHRRERRDQVKARWTKWFKPRGKRSNKHTREASTDSAQLDLVDWLARRWPNGFRRPAADIAPEDAEGTAGKPSRSGKSYTSFVDELGRNASPRTRQAPKSSKP